MLKKLRIKFIVAAMLALTAVLVSIIGVINVRNYKSVTRRTEEMLLLLDKNDGAFPPQGDKKNGGGFSPETPFETRYFTVTLNENGETAAVFMDRIAAIDRETAESYAKSLYASGKSSGFKGDYGYRAFVNDGKTKYVFLDCSRELDSFRSFYKTSVIISAAGLLAVFALVFVFSGIAMRPVAESYAKQKRFITDANHELKTPLTVIGASCEMLEYGGVKNEWTDSIKEQVKRLADLTEKLVFLSRADEENSKTVLTDFSLSEVSEEAVKPYVILSKAQGKSFSYKINPEVSCRGDAVMIKRALSMLLDNAFKYSTKEGDIELSVDKAGKTAAITLSNATDGIKKGDHSELFERFYRTDSSRNSETGGHGIGLSVVKAIIDLNGGKIKAESLGGKKIIFAITLKTAKL